MMTSAVPEPSSRQRPEWTSTRNGIRFAKELNFKRNGSLTSSRGQGTFGPCSYDALTAFSQAPSLTDYQILLVDAHRHYHITTYGDPKDKQLILLHDHNHYDVITRLPGFFGSSYVCAHCWKPYDHEGQHRCTKKKQCRVCCQKSALISRQRTLETRKPHNVATVVIGTFLETPVSKCISSRTTRANLQPTYSPPSAFVAIAVVFVLNWTWD